MQNGIAILEDSVAVSYKTKHDLTYNPAIMSLGIYPEGIENLCPHKNLHIDVYSSFSHMEYWTMEYYSALKSNAPKSHEKTWRN